MEHATCTPSVPVVIRVKRRADEDPLDVLRLRPLRTKVARGTDGKAFELQHLQFRHTGTILETENLASRTADLTSTFSASTKDDPATEIKSVQTTVSTPLVAGAAAAVFPQKQGRNEAGERGLSSQMFIIAQKFRTVTADGLLPLVDQLGNAVILDDYVGFGTGLTETKGDLHARLEVGKAAETSNPTNGGTTEFVLCDLETVRMEAQESSTKRKRRNDDVTGLRTSKMTCNGQELLIELKEPSDFVYDIYTLKQMEGKNVPVLYSDVFTCLDDMDVILGTNCDNVLWEDPWLNSGIRDEDADEDDDSNDEDNWRNEYPEEEESSENSSDEDDEIGEETETELSEADAFGGSSFSRYRSTVKKKRISSDSDAMSGTEDEDDNEN